MSNPVINTNKYLSAPVKGDRSSFSFGMECDRKEEEELSTYFGGSKRKNMAPSASSSSTSSSSAAATAAVVTPVLNKVRPLVIPADRKVIEANSIKPLISGFKLTEVEIFIKIGDRQIQKMTGYLSPNGTFFYLNKKGEMISNLCSFELLWHIDVDLNVPFIGVIQKSINKKHYNFALNCIFVAGNSHQSLGDMIRGSSPISMMSISSSSPSPSPYTSVSPYGFDSPPRTSPKQPSAPPNIKLERFGKIAEVRHEVEGFTIVPRKIWFNNQLVPETSLSGRM